MSDDKSEASANTAVLAAGRLFFFLWLLPCFCTLFHVRRNIIEHWDETIIVDVNTASISAVASGMYGRKLSQPLNDEIIYYKLLKIGQQSANVFGIYRPDVLDAAESAVGSEHEFPYLSIVPSSDQRNTSEPCIFMSKANKICGQDVINTRDMSRNTLNASLTTRKHWIHHVIFQVPATSFWILINCSLAFLYWNKRVAPETVAKIYSRIIPTAPVPTLHTATEVWRVLSGSTAHFEPLHLGMNMLSLSALGRELEGRQLFTSISFFMNNLSLIVIVPAIWLCLQHIIQMYYPNNHDANGATVGYSGVLFAWMVVASLGQESTCPILFAPDICFPTYELFGPFKFSFSPLVQLALMQVILPRVSFTGHLSGIIAGFLIHWKWLPIRYIQPALLVPIMYLTYLLKIRNAFATSVESGERPHVPISLFKTILGYQAIVLFYSFTVIGPISATTLSFAITMMNWYQFYTALNQGADPYKNVATWAKAYVLSAVLVLITDAMTVGGWIAFSSWNALPILVMLVRGALLFFCMIVALTTIPKVDNGIFELTLNYTTLYPCREIGQVSPWLRTITSDHSPLSGATLPVTSGSAFDGVGHRLGGSNSLKTNPWKVQRDVGS